MPESLFDKFTEETLAHVLSCELCEISKNTLFTEYPWASASEQYLFGLLFAGIPQKNSYRPRYILFNIYIYIYIHEYLLVCLKRNNSQIFKSIAGAKNIFSGAHVVGTTCFNKYFLFLVITRQHFFNKKLSLPLRCFSTTIFLLSLQQVIWKKSASK